MKSFFVVITLFQLTDNYHNFVYIVKITNDVGD